MATKKEYLEYVMEQLSGVPRISYRAMMGEYILYLDGRVFGGVYDDRLLLKPTPTACAMLSDAPREVPYDGAKEMLLADPDERDKLALVVTAMFSELPEPKKRK